MQRDDFSQLSKLPKIDRHLLRGTLGHRLFLIRARRWKEELGQANFDANVLPEPAGRLEIVKHVTGYGKILSQWDLKLKMAPQEVISTDRHIRQGWPSVMTPPFTFVVSHGASSWA